MLASKTTRGARAELAECRAELGNARRRIAALESRANDHIEYIVTDKIPIKSERKPRVKKLETGRPAPQGELLYGTQAIADFLGIRRRQALHLVEQKRIPHFRVERIVCATRSTLKAWLIDLEISQQGGE